MRLAPGRVGIFAQLLFIFFRELVEHERQWPSVLQAPGAFSLRQHMMGYLVGFSLSDGSSALRPNAQGKQGAMKSCALMVERM